jgi:hypothetical protein
LIDWPAARPREEIMRTRLALSLFAGCAALLSAWGVAAQAPAPGVQAIPPSTPEAPRDADGNLMTGKPFIACGPTTGSQIGILPNSVRNTSAQNAAASANAGRGAAAGATGATGAGRARGAAPADPAAGGRGAAATPRLTTTDPAILAGMRAAVDPRGGNGGLPNACNWADHTGFTSIFDGTLRGWEGDMRFWRAERDENGDPMIVGISTAEAPSGNAYLTYRLLQARIGRISEHNARSRDVCGGARDVCGGGRSFPAPVLFLTQPRFFF